MGKVAAFLLGIVLVTSALHAGDVRSKIDARNAEFTSAWNRGDVDAVVAIYDDGFIVMGDSSEPVTNRDALRKDIAGGIAALSKMKFETVSLQVHGDFAYEVGLATYIVNQEDGTKSPGKDRYLVVWKKDDKGTWNYHVDIYWGDYSDDAVKTATGAQAPAKATGDLSDAERLFQGAGRLKSDGSAMTTGTLSIDGRDFSADTIHGQFAGYVSIRSDTSPAQIDFTIQGCECKFDGMASTGIYRMDGDTIVFATTAPGEPRPKAFTGLDETKVMMVRATSDSGMP
jgi:uncharacterized protein (TIGR03067 family)